MSTKPTKKAPAEGRGLRRPVNIEDLDVGAEFWLAQLDNGPRRVLRAIIEGSRATYYIAQIKTEEYAPFVRSAGTRVWIDGR